MGLLKKINKIIVKIIKKYLLILEEEKKKTTFLFVFLTYLPLFLLKNTNKKSSFFYDTYPQIYIKEVFKTYMVFQI